ncbi:MAG: hypothetical protein NTW19_17105 [Planctomycetota bacterium]|nr:hypothetical protein [Planctomycetota bacterium]
MIWQGEHDRLVLSPRLGGRVIAWQHRGREMVFAPLLLEGGLLRTLFAEEQYPGSSFATPHRVLSHTRDGQGFRAHLRHYWNTPNWFMRAAGWPEKANELHIDGLVLDKVVCFDPSKSCLVCDMTITNVSGQTRYFTPWMHSSFADWPDRCWVVVNGKKEPYQSRDIYWGDHLATPGSEMRLVHASADGKLFSVLGGSTEHLKGMSALLPVPGEFHQSPTELRHTTIELSPDQRWRSIFFLALTDDWRRWAQASPVEPRSTVEPAGEVEGGACSQSMLDQWMLPGAAERESGLMVLSFLDKPPFSSASRYAASHSFAGFHPLGSSAVAHVMLYSDRDLGQVTAQVEGDQAWQLKLGDGAAAKCVSASLRRNDFVRLSLTAPADLHGKDAVRVGVETSSRRIELRIAPEARVEPRYPYQVRQAPAYLTERHRDRLGPFADGTPTREEFLAWQQRMRRRLVLWLEANAAGPCDPEPRLVERQEGPTCVREKWLIQTESGIWVPGFLIRPHGMTGRRPLIYHLHGSGPGKDGYAGDEMPSPVRAQLHHELEYMPYAIATGLNCSVYVPDGRGQGEMGETNPAIWSARAESLGIANEGLRVIDQIRALDWLIQRADVDPAKVGSGGCSGGGGMTYFFAMADERVAASIVSSTAAARPLAPRQPGYFHRMFGDRVTDARPTCPISGAPAGMLIAPRMMWIIDGLDDLGIEREQRHAWRKEMQAGRDQIRRAYELLGAGDRYRDDWLTGGHCAGMLNLNVVAYFRKWLEG